jgi:hypothetical protein
MNHRMRAALTLAAVIALPAQSAPAAEPARCLAERFRIVALPFRPAALNASGDIVGTDQQHHPALLTVRGDVLQLPLPAGFEVADALSLDDSRRVLAVATDRTANRHRAYIVTNRRITLLDGEQTLARRIGPSGVVAGEALLSGHTRPDPVIWDGGAPKPLGGCCGGSARDLNSSGAAVGDAYDPQGRYHAFLWTQGGGMQLIGPPDQYSSAVAINDAGVVVVQGLHQSYRYDGKLQPLPLAPRYPSHPRAINHCGLIVGSYGPYSDADRAFGWDPAAGFFDLNARLEPGSGWKLQAALGVNDAGMIIGQGDAPGADDAGFLLVPLVDHQ